jgi:hypothetical protein
MDPQGAFYVESLLGALITGDTVTNITGNGFNIYYDANAAGNAYLHGLNYALEGGGELIAITGASAVPEPETAVSFLAGLAGLGLLRRRRA